METENPRSSQARLAWHCSSKLASSKVESTDRRLTPCSDTDTHHVVNTHRELFNCSLVCCTVTDPESHSSSCTAISFVTVLFCCLEKRPYSDLGWTETCQLFQPCEGYAHQPAPSLMRRDAGGAGTMVRAPGLVFLYSVALKRQWFASQDFSLMHELSPHICLVNSGLAKCCLCLE